MSWICTSPVGQIREFFDARNVERARAAGWKVETAAEYLARVNAEIKASREQVDA